jgi:uncharacterized protein YraI
MRKGRIVMKRFGLVVFLGLLLLGLWGVGQGMTAVQAQTVPTRTPTPGSGGGGGETNTPIPQPTDTPGSGGGGGTTNPPPPSNTPEGGATAVSPAPTATPTATATRLVINPALTSGDACGAPVFVANQNNVNVRQGPGGDYALVTQIPLGESRPVVGRAANTAWWVVDLDNGQTGWVANEVGVVVGQGSGVPIVPPPALNGATPTAVAPFQPTPNPQCTPLPTATATSQVVATPNLMVTRASQATPIGTEMDTGMAGSTDDNRTEAESETMSEVAQATAVPPTATPPLSPTLPPTVTPETTTTPANSGSGGTNWLLWGGLGLMLVGIVWMGWQRWGKKGN